jgi:hypothetical protein
MDCFGGTESHLTIALLEVYSETLYRTVMNGPKLPLL